MIDIRLCTKSDIDAVTAVVARTLREVNIKDYGEEYIEQQVKEHNSDIILDRMNNAHFYVIADGDKIVGCGGVSSYWGSVTESCFLTIFILPEYEHKGLGTRLIKTLEADEFFLRAKRVEIPASLTAFRFYMKLGYDYKDGIEQPCKEGFIRLEKFR